MQKSSKYKHLVGYATYVRKKKYRVWIVLDNIDQGTYKYQEFVYTFAHKLSSEAGCVTLITLREDTFLEAQDAGFLNVRSSDIVFRLNAPELRQVIAKRRRYIDYALEHKKLPHYLKPHTRLVELLNWHIKQLFLGNNDALRKLIAAFSLNNVRYSLQMIEDYYASYHSLFHDIFARYKDNENAPTDQTTNIANEFTHFLQALMLKTDWSYDERDSVVTNLFSVDTEEQTSHFIALVILSYLSREGPSPRNSVRIEKLCGDLVFYGYPRHHIENTISKLLKASILLSPKVPVGVFTKQELLELNDDLKLTISAKGYYYLNHLAGDPYYQARVGEDTIWYDEEKATAYVRALRESFEAKGSRGATDLLLATNAREVFLQYLRRSWLQEYQLGRARAQSEKIRVINSIVEQRLFGAQITQSVYMKEDDHPEEPERPTAYQPTIPDLIKRGSSTAAQMTNEQLSFLPNETIDYDKAFRDAALTLGAMPKELRLNRSTYIIRVLWAMELAFRCGLTTVRASDIARIINKYGNGEVAAPNVAKFFRNQKSSGEYIHLWREFPEGYYTINNTGRDFLESHLADIERK